MSLAVFGDATGRLAKSRKFQFYGKLDETLASFGFAERVRTLCAPAYDQSGLGQPGIDPVVYLKMLMVGFFENLPSERAIAETCADSLAVRVFLNLGLKEMPPEHSSFTRIRQRLGAKIYQEIFVLILSALQAHGLVGGQHLGLDSSVMEANASLRELVNRNTEEAYWDYVKRLAREQGIDPDDREAVRRFDRKRPKEMKNTEWVNPHDPEAKISRKKDGATDMLYKPEVIADLETGSLVEAEILPADQADSQGLVQRLLAAQQTINTVQGKSPGCPTVQSATTDKGYYAVEEIQKLQRQGIKANLRDPQLKRRPARLSAAQAAAVQAAQHTTRSALGKKLLRRRGMHLERSFAHILDCGGMRRATLRGLENLRKRFKLSGAFYNLSQLMRHLFGVGTSKQWVALNPAISTA